jgi:hypothetical protein
MFADKLLADASTAGSDDVEKALLGGYRNGTADEIC